MHCLHEGGAAGRAVGAVLAAARMKANAKAKTSTDVALEQPTSGLATFLDEASLTDGQRRRIARFRSVESAACARIEQLCVSTGIEVVDVAVLVVDPSAHELVFQGEPAAGTCVLIGHRDKIREFLSSVLPPAEKAPFDPYEDLMHPAPARCVRVLIIDHESLTVMSYGTFVTVRIHGADMPEA